jgi:hypothetical protein
MASIKIRVLRRYVAKLGGLPCSSASCEHRSMSFPSEEVVGLCLRLEAKGVAYTSRVDAEQGKWQVGEEVVSPMGHLRIEAIQTTDLQGHPFRDELEPGQRAYLAQYSKIDVIRVVPAIGSGA